MALIDELRKISGDLKARNEDEVSIRKELATNATRRQAQLIRERATKVLAEVPGLAKAAAYNGKTSCVVYRHDYDERNYDSGAIRSWPIGAAKLIKEGCEALGFEVEWSEYSRHGRDKPCLITIKW